MQARLLTTALIPTIVVLLLAGTTPAAETQPDPGLLGSSADALKPPLQQNQAENSLQIQAAASGPSTPILDDSTVQTNPRSHSAESLVSARSDLGNGHVLGRLQPSRYRLQQQRLLPFQQYPGDVEVYASIPVKPADGGAPASSSTSARKEVAPGTPTG